MVAAAAQNASSAAHPARLPRGAGCRAAGRGAWTTGIRRPILDQTGPTRGMAPHRRSRFGRPSDDRRSIVDASEGLFALRADLLLAPKPDLSRLLLFQQPLVRVEVLACFLGLAHPAVGHRELVLGHRVGR